MNENTASLYLKLAVSKNPFPIPFTIAFLSLHSLLIPNHFLHFPFGDAPQADIANAAWTQLLVKGEQPPLEDHHRGAQDKARRRDQVR